MDPEEFVRDLLLRMPRWIWGSYDYPELYEVVATRRPALTRAPGADAERG